MPNKEFNLAEQIEKLKCPKHSLLKRQNREKKKRRNNAKS